MNDAGQCYKKVIFLFSQAHFPLWEGIISCVARLLPVNHIPDRRKIEVFQNNMFLDFSLKALRSVLLIALMPTLSFMFLGRNVTGHFVAL